MSIGFALSAACFLGLGFVVQQHAAHREPLERVLHFSLLISLARKPLWLAGIGAMVCGQLLGATALGRGDISGIEPLLATSLIFALVIAHALYRERLSRSEWVGAVLASAGTAIFLLAGRPSGGGALASLSPRWLAAGGAVAIAGLLAAASRHVRLTGLGAVLLAAAGGVLFGVQDSLTRAWLLATQAGLARSLTHWQPYALVAIAIVGLLLTQSAFDAAPLHISLPAGVLAEPLTGIALGVAVFGERLRDDPLAIAGQCTALAAIVGGMVLVCRSTALRQRPHGASGSGSTGTTVPRQTVRTRSGDDVPRYGSLRAHD
jgi:drug/metabolite transporter (DMT)-like permease